MYGGTLGVRPMQQPAAELTEGSLEQHILYSHQSAVWWSGCSQCHNNAFHLFVWSISPSKNLFYSREGRHCKVDEMPVLEVIGVQSMHKQAVKSAACSPEQRRPSGQPNEIQCLQHIEYIKVCFPRT